MDGEAIREQLRSWILERAGAPGSTDLADDTPILENGLLSSLDVVELVLFIESLRGAEVDLTDIEPEVLADVNSLYAAFFDGA